MQLNWVYFCCAMPDDANESVVTVHTAQGCNPRQYNNALAKDGCFIATKMRLRLNGWRTVLPFCKRATSASSLLTVDWRSCLSLLSRLMYWVSSLLWRMVSWLRSGTSLVRSWSSSCCCKIKLNPLEYLWREDECVNLWKNRISQNWLE